MVHLEMLARVVHADRVRDLERAAEAHRLVTEARDVAPAASVAEPAIEQPVVEVCVPADVAPRIGGSADLAA